MHRITISAFIRVWLFMYIFYKLASRLSTVAIYLSSFKSTVWAYDKSNSPITIMEEISG